MNVTHRRKVSAIYLMAIFLLSLSSALTLGQSTISMPPPNNVAEWGVDFGDMIGFHIQANIGGHAANYSIAVNVTNAGSLGDTANLSLCFYEYNIDHDAVEVNLSKSVTYVFSALGNVWQMPTEGLYQAEGLFAIAPFVVPLKASDHALHVDKTGLLFTNESSMYNSQLNFTEFNLPSGNALDLYNSTLGSYLNMTFFANGTLNTASLYADFGEGPGVVSMNWTRMYDLTELNPIDDTAFTLPTYDVIYTFSMGSTLIEYQLINNTYTTVESPTEENHAQAAFLMLHGDIYRWNGVLTQWVFNSTDPIGAANDYTNYPVIDAPSNYVYKIGTTGKAIYDSFYPMASSLGIFDVMTYTDNSTTFYNSTTDAMFYLELRDDGWVDNMTFYDPTGEMTGGSPMSDPYSMCYTNITDIDLSSKVDGVEWGFDVNDSFYYHVTREPGTFPVEYFRMTIQEIYVDLYEDMGMNASAVFVNATFWNWTVDGDHMVWNQINSPFNFDAPMVVPSTVGAQNEEQIFFSNGPSFVYALGTEGQNISDSLSFLMTMLGLDTEVYDANSYNATNSTDPNQWLNVTLGMDKVVDLMDVNITTEDGLMTYYFTRIPYAELPDNSLPTGTFNVNWTSGWFVKLEQAWTSDDGYNSIGVDFGDGEYLAVDTADQIIYHRFTHDGTFNVTFTVIDGNGDQLVVTKSVTVNNVSRTFDVEVGDRLYYRFTNGTDVRYVRFIITDVVDTVMTTPFGMEAVSYVNASYYEWSSTTRSWTLSTSFFSPYSELMVSMMQTDGGTILGENLVPLIMPTETAVIDTGRQIQAMMNLFDIFPYDVENLTVGTNNFTLSSIPPTINIVAVVVAEQVTYLDMPAEGGNVQLERIEYADLPNNHLPTGTFSVNWTSGWYAKFILAFVCGDDFDTVAIDYGDGSDVQIIDGSTPDATVYHRFTRDGTFNVTMTATDVSEDVIVVTKAVTVTNASRNFDVEVGDRLYYRYTNGSDIRYVRFIITDIATIVLDTPFGDVEATYVNASYYEWNSVTRRWALKAHPMTNTTELMISLYQTDGGIYMIEEESYLPLVIPTGTTIYATGRQLQASMSMFLPIPLDNLTFTSNGFYLATTPSIFNITVEVIGTQISYMKVPMSDVIMEAITTADLPNNFLPIANFTVTVVNGTASFVSTSDAGTNIINYRWDFGDGYVRESGSYAFISHEYALNGTYSVSLTVTDENGDTATYTMAVVVEIEEEIIPPPPPTDDTTLIVIIIASVGGAIGLGGLTWYLIQARKVPKGLISGTAAKGSLAGGKAGVAVRKAFGNCPTGTMRVGNVCIPTNKCPTGQTWNGTACVFPKFK